MVNDSIDNLRLDINKPKARVSLSVRKGDTKTRTIHVSLTSNGAVYSLENVLIAELLINKPDGKVCDQDMVIKGNELQYTFRTQDTNVEGECVCQIRLMFKDGAYLVSPEFYMYVYNMILDNKTSKSENEYSHTDELLVKANEYYENAETLSKQVEDAVTEASGYADTAEGFKDDAETAKTAAETAQTAAETAKTGAETAKTGAETAKAGAEAALASAQAIDTNVSTLKATCLQAVTDCKAEVVNAQTEVTNATNQATLAAASAVAAATSATNAATSEGNALNYAQDALNSELHAKGFKDDAEAAKNDLESKLITATNTNAGIVKPDGVSITVAADGTISASGSGAIASTTTLGSVKVDGTTITADPDGTIHGATTTPIATTTTEGTVKPDGTTITVLADGTISAVDTTPIATTTAVGTVKADGTTITVAADGTISSTGTTSPIATTSTAGIVIPDGTTITVDSLGKISAVDATPIATTTTEGTVKPDGTTITVLADGTISAVDQTPIATTSVAGTVIPDGTTITVDASGNISAVDQTPIATTSVAGSVIPDGTTITVDASGNISAVQQEADDVTYDNTTSGLTATDVQDAIDEVNTALGTKLDATDYKKTVSSVNGTNIHITDSVESNMVLNDAVVNLLNTLDYAWSTKEDTLTVTNNADKTITFNGTTTKNNSIKYTLQFKKGTYTISGCPKTGSNTTYRMIVTDGTTALAYDFGDGATFTLNSDTKIYVYIDIRSGYAPSNLTFKPMLEKGTVAHSYVPPQYDITSCGKNLIKNNFTVGSKSGITCSLNSDRTYTISGNASATTGNNFYVDISGLKSTNSYIISGCPSGGSDTTYRLRVFGGLQGSSGMASDLGSGTTVTGYDSYRLAIQIIQTGVDTNLVFKPMLRLATDTDDTYEPYQSAKVTVSSDTVFPLNGLKSFNGITNVFNDYNADMEVVYANDNVGSVLLDASPKHSNPNLLDNPWFTVNQRGVTTWSGEKINYFVDRWIAYIGTDSSVSITDGGLKCVRATNYCYIQQKLPSDLKPMLIGKIATFSLLLSNNEVYSITTQLSDDRYYEMMFSKDIGVNFGYNLTGTVPVFQFVLNKTLDITIKAVKLEFGSVSTLANDIAPNYATELVKCQRYYQKLGGMTYLGMGTAGAISKTQCYPIIQLAVPMRAVPSVTYNLASIYVYGGGLANTKGDISAITVNKYIANMPNIKLSITVSADLFTAGQVYNVDFGDSHYIELSADI